MEKDWGIVKPTLTLEITWKSKAMNLLTEEQQKEIAIDYIKELDKNKLFSSADYGEMRIVFSKKEENSVLSSDSNSLSASSTSSESHIDSCSVSQSESESILQSDIQSETVAVEDGPGMAFVDSDEENDDADKDDEDSKKKHYSTIVFLMINSGEKLFSTDSKHYVIHSENEFKNTVDKEYPYIYKKGVDSYIVTFENGKQIEKTSELASKFIAGLQVDTGQIISKYLDYDETSNEMKELIDFLKLSISNNDRLIKLLEHIHFKYVDDVKVRSEMK